MKNKKAKTEGGKMQKEFADAVSKAIQDHLAAGNGYLEGNKFIPNKPIKNKSFIQKIIDVFIYYWTIIIFWLNNIRSN